MAATTVDEYIASCPPDQQVILQKVRDTIRQAAPNAVERIAWDMPTYRGKRNLIHFAASKNHLGVYPGSEIIKLWADKLAGYSTSAGTIRFPWDKPIPYDLIADIVKRRVEMDGA